MTDADLPAEFAAVERALAALPRPEPAADLGPRMLAAVRRALPTAAPGAAPSARWRSWAALAAGLLFAANLSMSVANVTDWSFAGQVESGQITATAAALHAATPELTEAEARRQALLSHAAADLIPVSERPASEFRLPRAEEH